MGHVAHVASPRMVSALACSPMLSSASAALWARSGKGRDWSSNTAFAHARTSSRALA